MSSVPADVFLASTQFGVVSLVSFLAQCGGKDENRKRILLYSLNGSTPELEFDVTRSRKWKLVLEKHFDICVVLNEVIFPTHPASLKKNQIAGLGNYLKSFLGCRVDRIFCESIQVSPARAFVQAFPGAEIWVYSEGLMSYGPTRFKLEKSILDRITTVLYGELLSTVRPELLSEVSPRYLPTSLGQSFELLSDIFVDEVSDAALEGSALIYVGQYLAGANICAESLEEEITFSALSYLVKIADGRPVYYKPHPRVSFSLLSSLKIRYRETFGEDLRVLLGAVPIELLAIRYKPALIAGVFSTSLITCGNILKIPVCTMGLSTILGGLAPLQNSNRIPMVVCREVLHEEDFSTGSFAELIQKIDARRGVVDYSRLEKVIRLVAMIMHWERYEALAVQGGDMVADGLSAEELALYVSGAAIPSLMPVKKIGLLRRIKMFYKDVIPYPLRKTSGDLRRKLKDVARL
jgi:hypothetical protein